MIVFTGMMVLLQTMAPFELDHVGAWEPADVKACILFGWKWNPKSRTVGDASLQITEDYAVTGGTPLGNLMGSLCVAR
jgi:hypothetical protein